jgi:hypothetical protein
VPRGPASYIAGMLSTSAGMTLSRPLSTNSARSSTR